MTVTEVAQVKFLHDPDLLKVTAQSFLVTKQHEIKRIVLPTFEGHLSDTLSTWRVEEAYKARAQFVSLFSKDAQPYVGRMGIEIIALTINYVYDALIIIYYIQSIFITASLRSFRNIEI